jgi:hypothetical protein
MVLLLKNQGERESENKGEEERRDGKRRDGLSELNDNRCPSLLLLFFQGENVKNRFRHDNEVASNATPCNIRDILIPRK